MFPYSPFPNQTDSADMHAEHWRDFCLFDTGSTQLPNFAHFYVGQFGTRCMFATQNALGVFTQTVSVTARHAISMHPRPVAVTRSKPPFSLGVYRVVRASTKKQMFRVDAGRIIAAMAHFQLVWVNAITKKVRNAMCPVVIVLNAKCPHTRP